VNADEAAAGRRQGDRDLVLDAGGPEEVLVQVQAAKLRPGEVVGQLGGAAVP
jgi:hypothetical protein